MDDMIRKHKENLMLQIEKMHMRNSLAGSIPPDYYEPGMMEYLEYTDGTEDGNGTVVVSFESKGTRYDGRTELIEKIRLGDKIIILRDPENIYNHNNFRLFTEKNQDVGNMPAELCNVIAPLYDTGYLTLEHAEVSYVEPISKRSRYAKSGMLFVKAVMKVNEKPAENDRQRINNSEIEKDHCGNEGNTQRNAETVYPIDNGTTGIEPEKWIFPCNIKYYDVFGALRNLRVLNWKQTISKIKVGDYVYIYVGNPISEIMFKCRVNKVLLNKKEIDDSAYVLGGEVFESYPQQMEIELVEEFPRGMYTFEELQKRGLQGRIMGPRRAAIPID